MKTIACFLQNAWSPLYAGRRWPRESWLRALKASRSGQRLRGFESGLSGFNLHWDNTTPICGDCSDSVLQADPKHIRRVLLQAKPSVVVTFGTYAAKAVTDLTLGLPVLQLPHPASRLVTNELCVRAVELLNMGFFGVVNFRQARGSVLITWSSTN